ncbi:MAG: hypothetical protein WC717_04245 [Candidatus Micrarchaeia archaeon]
METNRAVFQQFDAKVEKIIIVGSLFCADSRNTTESYYAAKAGVLEDLSRQGVRIDFFRMNDPGTFMTPMAAHEFMWHFMQKKIEYSEFASYGVPIEYHLHVVGHAHARHLPEFQGKKTYDAGALDIVKACATNCGMSHADVAAANLQDFLLSSQPTFIVGGKEVAISTKDALRKFMRETYGNRGAPAGWDGDLLTWIKPIHDLRSHPLEQVRLFEAEAGANGAFMKEIPEVQTFSQVLNYGNNKLYRVDGKQSQEDLVLRPIFRKIRESPVPPSDQAERTSEQAKLSTPSLLISDPYVSEARHLYSRKVLRVEYKAGTVFSIARMVHSGPFDLPSCLGAFYDLSPLHLNRHDQGTLGIVGRKLEGATALSGKVQGDQVMRYMVETYVKKNIHMLGVANPRQSFPAMNPNLDRFISQSMQARRM